MDFEKLNAAETNENKIDESHDVEQPMGAECGSLVEEEEKETGVVKLGIYKAYWKAVGACLAPSVLIALFLMQGL